MKKLFAAIIGFVLVINLTALADGSRVSDGIIKIERVRWSGISPFGLRLFGSWAKAQDEPGLFGAVSPYFRLNGDDRTVFRGLGRESGFAQYVLPKLNSRGPLRDIMSGSEPARRSLMKFDDQISPGGKSNMVSSGLAVGGDDAMVAGIVMMFASLGKESEFGETPPMLKNGYIIASAGIAMWTVGKVGQLAGAIVTKQSFSHLKDAIGYFNEGQ